MKVLIIPILIAIFALSCSEKEQFSEFETVRFTGSDTLTVTADFYRTPDKEAPILVMFHQSASSRGEYATIAPDLQKRGFNCLAVDLRWGKKDFWNDIPNETGKRFGSWEAIDNYENTEDYQYREVWPRMFDSVKDMKASIDYLKQQGYNGPMIVWGSSFSAMLVFDLANQRRDDIDGIISYSPGEYYGKDTLMLTNWIKEIKQPVFINSGKSEAEFQMTTPLFDILPGGQEHKFYQSKEGRHGSSVLMQDEGNWPPLLEFLNQFKKEEEVDFSIYTVEIGKWLNYTSGLNSNGVWPDKLEGEPTINLSQGVSGKVLFFIEMFKSTNDSSYLNEAISGGDFILKNLKTAVDSAKVPWPFGSYGPVCGAGKALIELSEVTERPEYFNGVLQTIQIIEEHASNKADTVSWGPGNDILGGLAGTGLYLLEAGRFLKDREMTSMAEKVARTLFSRAIPDAEGLNWYFGQDRRFVLPNFSHGAAGTGFFFGRLYEETRNDKYLKAALRVAEYLKSVRVDSLSQGFLLPYGIPNEGWSSAYDIGWAHGPAGTARFFQQMYQVTNDEIWLTKMKECFIAVKASGIPIAPNPAFGNTTQSINYRFGMAGVAHFAIDLFFETGEKQYLDYAENLVEHILTKGRISENGMHWPITQRDGTKTSFTGHFYGASGYGLLLLKLNEAKKDRQIHLKLIDEVKNEL